MLYLNPVGSVFFILGKIIRFTMFFFFIFFLVAKTKALHGYTVNQAIIFYLTFSFIDSLAQTLFRQVYYFRQSVITGELNGILIKPYHPFLRILFGGIDFLDSLLLIPYLLLLSYFIGQLGGITLSSLVGYLLLILNAIAIAAAFHIGVLAFGIITTEIDHAIMIYRDMTELGRFPIDIYKEPLRGIFTFIIPVGVMMTFPTKVLFNILSPQLILYSFFFALTFLLISLKFWDYSIKKYQSWGG
jgi:ABC-2 type transport system permease protein